MANHSLWMLFEQSYSQSEQIIEVHSIAQLQQLLIMFQGASQVWVLIKAFILALDLVNLFLNLRGGQCKQCRHSAVKRKQAYTK